MGDVLVVHRWDAAAAEETEAVPRGFFAGYVEGWLADDAHRPAVLELYADLVGASAYRFATDRIAAAAARLAEAFARGELLAVRIPETAASGGASTAKKPEEKKPEPEPPKEKTWIRVKVVDPDDNPVAGVKLELKLPDGSVRKVTVDDSGEIDIDGIDPGSCELALPEYDGGDWRVL